MVGLQATRALDLWERAQPLAPIERAVELAAAAAPVAARDDVAALPLGRRDARLLALRDASARASLDATARCPACGEDIEFSPAAAQLLEVEPAAAAPLERDGFAVHWRLPDSRDALAAAAAADAATAHRILLDRCVLAATGPAGPVAASELPPAVCAALDAAIAAADPLAEILIDLACPACGAAFAADLDVASFVWAELDAAARELLGDVDELARAYGWTEPEVLALSDRRRASYLRLVREDAL
ncbi:MAG: hypothetical protein QOI64_2826 [Solirubrobacteraceae bacterium]|jgi:hypothetical protein|nr:hypothetical protein [Solirubrobacteraceae bacterium]